MKIPTKSGSMRIFSIAHKYNDEWCVEAEFHGQIMIVHSGKSLYAVLRWASEHGYHDKSPV